MNRRGGYCKKQFTEMQPNLSTTASRVEQRSWPSGPTHIAAAFEILPVARRSANRTRGWPRARGRYSEQKRIAADVSKRVADEPRPSCEVASPALNSTDDSERDGH